MRTISFTALFIAIAAAGILSACSPRFDWRDYRGASAGYSALFPGKPASLTRMVELDGLRVAMSMTAAEVDGTTFAVGSAALATPAQAQAALLAMKTAMLNNIGAGVTRAQAEGMEIEAVGTDKGRRMLLVGRFIARGARVYQVIVLGPEQSIERDSVDTFMSSFKPD